MREYLTVKVPQRLFLLGLVHIHPEPLSHNLHS